jgi:3-oxoacyl-ACP reductase-like protein
MKSESMFKSELRSIIIGLSITTLILAIAPLANGQSAPVPAPMAQTPAPTPAQAVQVPPAPTIPPAGALKFTAEQVSQAARIEADMRALKAEVELYTIRQNNQIASLQVEANELLADVCKPFGLAKEKMKDCVVGGAVDPNDPAKKKQIMWVTKTIEPLPTPTTSNTTKNPNAPKKAGGSN